MKVRLLGRTVRTRTSVRYIIAVGGRRGSVTYSQYRLLTLLADARRRRRPADLSAHIDPEAVHQVVSRIRKRLHQINPKCPESCIIPQGQNLYHARFFIQLPK